MSDYTKPSLLARNADVVPAHNVLHLVMGAASDRSPCRRGVGSRTVERVVSATVTVGVAGKHRLGSEQKVAVSGQVRTYASSAAISLSASAIKSQICSNLADAGSIGPGNCAGSTVGERDDPCFWPVYYDPDATGLPRSGLRQMRYCRRPKPRYKMLPSEQPDRIHVAFDDHRLVANAGLLLAVTLAQHLGLGELVDNHVDLGAAPGRASPGDKMLTLVASALAGGDCIDDADVLRTGRTAGALGCVVKAPSTLGTFLRSFRWGHVRQLDRVSRELLARVWAAGAGPGDGPLTIDLDSTICETYGLAKEGARDHGYTGKRGYHPLLAVAAGTGDVLLARLREGRANTARGAAHFLRETVS